MSKTYYLDNRDADLFLSSPRSVSAVQERQRTDRSHKIVMWSLIGVFAVVFAYMDSCVRDYDAEKKHEDLVNYLNFHQAEIPAAAMPVGTKIADINGDSVEVKAWSNEGGDWKKCRKNLLIRITGTADPKQQLKFHQGYMRAEIKGDTLIMYSKHFEEPGTRVFVREDMDQMFMDCKLKAVAGVLGCYGGAPGGIIWTDKTRTESPDPPKYNY